MIYAQSNINDDIMIELIVLSYFVVIVLNSIVIIFNFSPDLIEIRNKGFPS